MTPMRLGMAQTFAGGGEVWGKAENGRVKISLCAKGLGALVKLAGV